MLPILIGMAVGGFVGHVVNETAQNKKLENLPKDVKKANNEKGADNAELQDVAGNSDNGNSNGVDS